MDKIDIQLLRCLQKNSRAKASDISRQINLSVSAVIERIRKLEESGVIRQYTLLSVLFALAAGIGGLIVSYYLGCSAGAAISLLLAAIFAVTFCLRKRVG